MLTEQQALVASIRKNPNDRLSRLVYADWLLENGQVDYGNFIILCNTKVTCNCAVAPPHHCNLRREKEERQKAIQIYFDTSAEDWVQDAIPLLTHRDIGSIRMFRQTREMLYSDMSLLSTISFNYYTYAYWAYHPRSGGIGFYNGLPLYWRGRHLDWYDPKWGVGKEAIKNLPLTRVEFIEDYWEDVEIKLGRSLKAIEWALK